MAKKAAKKAATKAKRTKLVVTPTHLRDAGAIVAEVVVHFGAGYAQQRSTEGSPMRSTEPIFEDHRAFLAFQRFLLGCTSRNLARRSLSARTWGRPGNPTRSQVTLTAFAHGELARTVVVQDRTPALTEAQVMSTLETIKARCPRGPGGGDICHDN